MLILFIVLAVLVFLGGCWVWGVIKGPVQDALSDLVGDFYDRQNAKARLRARNSR